MKNWHLLKGKKPPSTKHQFNVVIGYFYNLNFILGTGFLGIPFTFYHAGIIPSLATLTILSVSGCITALWLLEILARARVLNKLRTGNEREAILNGNSGRNISTSIQDVYHISSNRKFEMTELCEIMFGLAGKIIFIIIMTIYCSLTLWSFSAVVGTSWSSNIPVNTSMVSECHETDFSMRYFPADTRCYSWYRVCVSVFGVVVTLLSLLELNEQKYIQAVFSILRFIALTSIIVFAIYLNIHNSLSPDSPTPPGLHRSNATASELVARFDLRWWLVTIPVLVYAQNLHQGIPSLTHPVVPKRRLKAMLIVTFITTWTFYTLLGVVVSFAFLGLINENATLCWNYFTGASTNIAVRIISYFIVLFPSLDIISAYPLVVTTLANNLYLVLMCRDTSEAMISWKDRIGKMLFRFVFASFPLIGGLFVSNLVTVLNFAGLFAFAMLFFVPILCQIQSKRLCVKNLGNNQEDVPAVFERLMPHGVSVRTESHHSDYTVSPIRHESPSHINKAFKNKFLHFLLYVDAETPYSGWYSCNLVIIIVSIVAIICFGLAIGSIISTLVQ